MKSVDWLDLIVSAATALGVFLAWWQIRASSQQTITSFEDSLSNEYRNLMQGIPVEALLGEDLNDQDYRANLGEFYHYIDLTNEQVFLRQCKRISPETWKNWCDGIQSLMSKQAFSRAWKEISERSPESFGELRRLISSGYTEDPAKWSRRN